MIPVEGEANYECTFQNIYQYSRTLDQQNLKRGINTTVQGN